MKRRKASLVIGCLVVISSFHLVLTVLPTNVTATDLFVGGGGPGNFTTIQSAVNAANPGDTVYVFSGTYHENVLIEKPLSLVGEYNHTTIIDGDANEAVIDVDVSWVNISGFTITNGTDWTRDGIRLNTRSHNHIFDNILMRNRRGMVVSGSYNTIENNIAYSLESFAIDLIGTHYNILRRNVMTGSGIRLHGSDVEEYTSHEIDTSNTVNGKPVYYWKNITGGTVPSGAGQVILGNCTNVLINGQDLRDGSVGITLGLSSNNTIINNDVSGNNAYGFILRRSDGNTVSDNQVSSINGTAYDLYYADSNRIENNTIAENRWGIRIMDSDGNLIANNTIKDSAEYAVRLWHSDYNELIFNEITDNLDGIILERSFRNLMNYNNITNNEDGIRLLDASYYNSIGNSTLTYNKQIGLDLDWALYTIVSDSNISFNTNNGLKLYDSSNSKILDNIISSNGEPGVTISRSPRMTLSGNNLTGNSVLIIGHKLSHWNTHDIDTTNSVNGNPVHYWKDVTGGTIPSGAGEVILANCTFVTVTNQNLSNVIVGMQIAYSSQITISNNEVSDTTKYGIRLERTDNSTVSDNSFSRNMESLVFYRDCNDNAIVRNAFSQNYEGVEIYRSSFRNTVRENTFTDNDVGMYVRLSDNNTITRNTFFSQNNYGLGLFDSYNNEVYHNDFVTNKKQAIDEVRASDWDDGYPSGGNYWSDYDGYDNCSGPSQDICPNPDGIGDTPYLVGGTRRDNYPLMAAVGGDVYPPIVSIDTPANGEIFPYVPIDVSGTSTDPGGSGIQHVEVRVNNGSWQNAVGTSAWSASVGLVKGPNYVEARAWDNAGYSSEIAAIIVIYSSRPVASFTVLPENGEVGTTFEMDASSSSDLEDSAAALVVRWDWENDGTWDTAYSTEKTAQHQYPSPWTYTIRLEVKDTSDLTDTTTRNVEVENQTEPSHLPVPTINSPSPDETVSGDYTIRGETQDPFGTVERVEIQIDEGGWTEVSGTTSWSYNWDTTSVPNGTHTIHVRSFNGTNYSDTSAITVSVENPPSPPPPDGWAIEWYVLVVLLVIVTMDIILAGVILWRRKKGQKKAPPEEPLAEIEEDESRMAGEEMDR